MDGDDREKGRKRYLIARGLGVEIVRGGAASLREVEDAARKLGAVDVIHSRDLEEWHGPQMVWAGWDATSSVLDAPQ